MSSHKTLRGKARAFVLHARKYAKRLWTWVRDPKKGWGVVAVLLATVLAIYLVPWELEKEIRWAGLILQLLGLGTVMFGLAGKGKQFNLDTPVALFCKWIKAFPKWSPPTQVAAVLEGMSAGDSMSSRVVTRSPVAPNATDSEKLVAVMADVDALYNTELPLIRGEDVKLEQRLIERMEREQANTSRQVSDVQTRLKGAVAGDVTLEWAGVVLLVFGLFFGTASLEIAGWFGK